jgi:hypothetical protein
MLRCIRGAGTGMHAWDQNAGSPRAESPIIAHAEASPNRVRGASMIVPPVCLFAEGKLETGMVLEAAVPPLPQGERPSSAAR